MLYIIPFEAKLSDDSIFAQLIMYGNSSSDLSSMS